MNEIKLSSRYLHSSEAKQNKQDNAIDVAPGTPARPVRIELFESILSRRLARRTFLKGVATAGPLLVMAPSLLLSGKLGAENLAAASRETSTLTFQPIKGSAADQVIIPNGYRLDVLLRWGDALTADVPDLNTRRLNQLLHPGAAARQAKQFGYNCDFNGFFLLPRESANTEAGLLVTNHEFTTEELMFPGWPTDDPARADFVLAYPEVVGVMKAAHGLSIVLVKRTKAGQWHYVRGAEFNRRITVDTPIALSGPAAGCPLLQTAADPSGTIVLGTLNNCAGGITPWGTVLSCEENFDWYFGNFEGLLGNAARGNAARALQACAAELTRYIALHGRIPMPEGQSERAWELIDERFDIAKHPKEAFRFGWVIEIDPYDPHSTPKKRTALGRFKHEGATTVIAPGGQVVVYCGDDARFEYIYKFVTKNVYRPDNRSANRELLDSGTLYVARFNDDGSGVWLPLVFGEGALTPKNGFHSQAEVLINARRAADLLGATPMDRPEDIETSPLNGKVYAVLTNNSKRTGEPRLVQAEGHTVATAPTAPNPRRPNKTGHIIEITEVHGNHAARSFTWSIFMLCGNPLDPKGRLLTALDGTPVGTHDTYFAGFSDANAISPIGSPDNIAFDRQGNLWVATDGQTKDLNLAQPINDGLYAVPVEGRERGFLRQFLSAPRGSEVVGPAFAPDARSLFVGIQHPGEGGTLDEPVSSWPEGNRHVPRPSVLVITKADGGLIGS